MAVKSISTNKNKKKPYSTKKTNKTLTKNTYNKGNYNKKGKNNNKKNYGANKGKNNANYKNNKVKRSVVVNKVDNTVSNTELLDKILEESKQKKLNKKKTIADKNTVRNKVVIDILKEADKKKKKPKDDLIITREIDLADLDEYLTKESKIIENKIDKETGKSVSDEDSIFITEPEKKKVKKKKPKKKKEEKPPPEPSMKELVDLSEGRIGPSVNIWNILIVIILFLLLVIVIVVGTQAFAGRDRDSTNVKKVVDEKKTTEEEKELTDYEKCLIREKNDLDTSEEIVNYMNDLNTYLINTYHVSVRYYELEHGFEYGFNIAEDYYAASTINALDGLYIYSKAATGEIKLDDTMTYTSKYSLSNSYYLTKHSYGDKISIKDLVRYAITRSDNRAHQMLVDYIGINNLKEFGLNLGATKTLDGDIFGIINVNDAIIYWQEIYKFINNNGDLGKELENCFKDAEQNFLEIPNKKIAAIHKYGEYGVYYHDIGIVYAEHPYIIAILSEEGQNQYEAMIKDINARILELNEMYIGNRENICNSEINK